ncbi:MAG: 30S ribosomal protein S14 [Alphaproteobacteria bacterium]|nr:MAG: 30S ribosomal protein S14 [Alphaproteobacteria bacterium]
MSKKSMIYRNLHRKLLCQKYKERRDEIKGQLKSRTIAPDVRLKLMHELNKLPRNSSPVRYRNRCQLTGRGRGVYRDFGLCRHKIKEFAILGYLPGVGQFSW